MRAAAQTGFRAPSLQQQYYATTSTNFIGGVPFDERLAAAKPGDTVPIALALRSPSALAVWAFAAVTPILLGSALGPDDEAAPRQPRRRSRLAKTQEPEQREVVDDLGVVRTEENASNQ